MNPQVIGADQWDQISRALIYLFLFTGLALSSAMGFLLGHAVLPSLIESRDAHAILSPLRWIAYPLSGAVALGLLRRVLPAQTQARVVQEGAGLHEIPMRGRIPRCCPQPVSWQVVCSFWRSPCHACLQPSHRRRQRNRSPSMTAFTRKLPDSTALFVIAPRPPALQPDYQTYSCAWIATRPSVKVSRR